MNHTALIGLLLVLLVLSVMVFVRARGARREKTLLAQMRYRVPDGYVEFHKRSDGVLFSKNQPRQVSLELRTACIPEDVAFKTHVESFLAAMGLPYEGLTEAREPAALGWEQLERVAEPYLRVIYKKVEDTWVFALLVTSLANKDSATEEAVAMVKTVLFGGQKA